MSAPTEISNAVETLVRVAREAFPDVEPTLLTWSLTPEGKQLQILAPGLRWHVISLEE